MGFMKGRTLLGAGDSLPALNPDFLYAALDATAYAAFVKESRKKRAGATKLHRKSGKRFFPRINAGATTASLDKSGLRVAQDVGESLNASGKI